GGGEGGARTGGAGSVVSGGPGVVELAGVLVDGEQAAVAGRRPDQVVSVRIGPLRLGTADRGVALVPVVEREVGGLMAAVDGVERDPVRRGPEVRMQQPAAGGACRGQPVGA